MDLDRLRRCGIQAFPALAELPLLHLGVRLTAETPIHLSLYSGSAIRGGLGAKLQETACLERPNLCGSRCRSPAGCSFGAAYSSSENIVSATSRQRGRSIVFRPPFGEKVINPGKSVQVDLLLFGPEERVARDIAQAFQSMAGTQLGRGSPRGRLSSIEVFEIREGRSIPLSSEAWGAGVPIGDLFVPLVPRLRLHFRTPLWLEVQKQRVMRPTPQMIADALFRRLASLGVLKDEDRERWRNFAGAFVHSDWRSSRFESREWERDRTQGESHPMWGVTGMLDFEFKDLREACALSVLVGLFGVGKSVAFGLGSPELEELP